jgi:hypothetical protein
VCVCVCVCVCVIKKGSYEMRHSLSEWRRIRSCLFLTSGAPLDFFLFHARMHLASCVYRYEWRTSARSCDLGTHALKEADTSRTSFCSSAPFSNAVAARDLRLSLRMLYLLS